MNNTVSDEFFLRLEVVAQTDTEANHGGLTIVNGSAGSSHILITLSVRQNTVHIGALAQVILVTNRGHIVLDIERVASSNTVSLSVYCLPTRRYCPWLQPWRNPWSTEHRP